MAAIIVLDAGTGGAKCAVFDAVGRRRAAHREAWLYTISENADFPFVKNFAFDPDVFWQALCRCVRAAVAASDLSADEVIGVVTTSQRQGCVFLGADGKELYAGPNLDTRGFSEGIDVLNTLGGDRLYEITGHSAPFIFPIARYLWFRKHDPHQVAHLLMINDWMTYRLSNVAAAEVSNATESMLFDLQQRTWSQEILDRFAIPASILPPVRQPGERIGALTAAAAAATGLAPGTPVFVGGADTQCGLLGAGATDAGDIAAILGTTTPVQAVVDHATFDPSATLWAGCHVVPERWVVESNAGDTGDAYNWFVDLLVHERNGRYDAAEQLAAAHARGSTFTFAGPCIFDLTKMRHDKPGGILFPFPAMHIRPPAGELLYSFLESVAFAVRGNMEQLRSVTGHSPSRLIIGGGMSRNRLLVHLLADVTGLPVQRADEPESAALGAAMLVAVGAGHYPDLSSAARAMSRHHMVEAKPVQVEAYAIKYAKWQELNDALDHASIG